MISNEIPMRVTNEIKLIFLYSLVTTNYKRKKRGA